MCATSDRGSIELEQISSSQANAQYDNDFEAPKKIYDPFPISNSDQQLQECLTELRRAHQNVFWFV